MINVLWIEDFGGGKVESTVDSLFGGIFGGILGGKQPEKQIPKLRKQLDEAGIFLRDNFQDGLSFIKEKSHAVDFIILDIDLKTHGHASEPNSETINILTKYYKLNNPDDEGQLNTSLSELKKCAGYNLYVELILNQQYPKEKIIFCSNHGENLNSINASFKAAMIEIPVIYTKNDPLVQEKVKSICLSDHYGTLRRAIIDGCETLKVKLSDEQNLQFNDLLQDEKKYMSGGDLESYLNLLAGLLPLQEPSQDEKHNLFKLFIRTLSHEWERDLNWSRKGKSRELCAFMNIMKNTRNWITHSSIFDSLTEEDVAFLFICNMRALFKLSDNLELYEEKLMLTLRGNILERLPDPLQRKKIKEGMLKQYKNISIEARSSYNIASFNKNLKKYQEMSENPSSVTLLNGLYQLFWFETSPGKIQISRNSGELVYDFQIDERYFEQDSKSAFFTKFAEHIYPKSKLV